MLRATYTSEKATASRNITRTKRYNDESWQAGRHTPNTGISSKQHCHLPEETGVQLLCAASCDIWCRDLDIHQTGTELICGRTYLNGKKYAELHKQGQKDQHLGQGGVKSHGYNQQCENNEVVLDRAHQQKMAASHDSAIG